MAYPRVIIEADAWIARDDHRTSRASGAHTPLYNSATHIALRQDAQIEHYRVFATGADATHIDSLQVRQDEGQPLPAVHHRPRRRPGARLARGASVGSPAPRWTAIRCWSATGSATSTASTSSTHAAPHTRSRQTARAIASGRQPRDLQQQSDRQRRRRARGVAAVLPRSAAVARTPKSIRGRSWKFMPTRSSARTARPPGGSTPTCCSTCCRAASTARPRKALLVYAFLADVLTGMSVGSARSAIENALISQLPDSQVLRKFR